MVRFTRPSPVRWSEQVPVTPVGIRQVHHAHSLVRLAHFLPCAGPGRCQLRRHRDLAAFFLSIWSRLHSFLPCAGPDRCQLRRSKSVVIEVWVTVCRYYNDRSHPHHSRVRWGFSGPFPHPKAFCYTNTRPIITTMPLQARTKRRNAALQASFQWPFLRGERWHHLRGERWHHLRGAAPGLNSCPAGRSAILSRSAIPTGAGPSSGHHPPPLRRQMSVIITM